MGRPLILTASVKELLIPSFHQFECWLWSLYNKACDPNLCLFSVTWFLMMNNKYEIFLIKFLNSNQSWLRYHLVEMFDQGKSRSQNFCPNWGLNLSLPVLSQMPCLWVYFFLYLASKFLNLFRFNGPNANIKSWLWFTHSSQLTFQFIILLK